MRCRLKCAGRCPFDRPIIPWRITGTHFTECCVTRNTTLGTYKKGKILTTPTTSLAHADMDLASSFTSLDWPALQQYALEKAIALPLSPKKSQCFIVEIPDEYSMSSLLWLPNTRGRVCKTGLVVKAHPEVSYGGRKRWRTNKDGTRSYASTKVYSEASHLKPGHIVTFIKIGIQEMIYKETWYARVRCEDIDCILNYGLIAGKGRR